MKALIISILVVMSFTAVYAGYSKPVIRGYCMIRKSTRSVVVHEKIPLRQMITLNDGTVLKPDGIVIRKNGYRFLLNEGECVLEDGTVINDDIK